MEKELNYANIVKVLLGDEMYLKLLKEISKENYQKDIALIDYYDEIFDKYCFIILMLGTSKKIDIDTYNIKVNKKTMKMKCEDFAYKYKDYIKIIEETRFEMIKTMI